MSEGHQPARPGGDAERLRGALRVSGLAEAVEGRGALALVVPGGAAFPLAAATRRWMVAMAQECGFSHVAIEVTSLADDGDGPTRATDA